MGLSQQGHKLVFSCHAINFISIIFCQNDHLTLINWNVSDTGAVPKRVRGRRQCQHMADLDSDMEKLSIEDTIESCKDSNQNFSERKLKKRFNKQGRKHSKRSYPFYFRYLFILPIAHTYTFNPFQDWGIANTIGSSFRNISLYSLPFCVCSYGPLTKIDHSVCYGLILRSTEVQRPTFFTRIIKIFCNIQKKVHWTFSNFALHFWILRISPSPPKRKKQLIITHFGSWVQGVGEG